MLQPSKLLLTILCAQPAGHDLCLGVELLDVGVQLAGQPHTRVHTTAEPTVLTRTLQQQAAAATQANSRAQHTYVKNCCTSCYSMRAASKLQLPMTLLA